MRGHLRAHANLNDRWVGDFLAGSYSRDTAIRPKKTEDGVERADVDIIVETSFTTADHPDDVLQEVSDALEDAFTVERINKRSVRVVTANAEIDVVPVIASGTIYQLPDRDLGDWNTRIRGHNDWSRDQNEDFDCRFKPLVKMFKWWRRENKTGKRPKGFVLEVLVARHAPRDEAHYGEAFAQMLESIYAQDGALAEAGVKPHINDPGLPGNNIISKVSITDWKNFIERIRVHAGYARRAQDEEDMAEATLLWRKLFGNRFHETVTAAKAESLAGCAVVRGRGRLHLPQRTGSPKHASRLCVTFWWLTDFQRVGAEKAAVEALGAEGDWFTLTRWTINEFRLSAEGVITAHGVPYPVRLVYPDQFPCVPAWVETQDTTVRWSNHQYGAVISSALAPARLSLAPCSPPSRTLRAASRWPAAILDRSCAQRLRELRPGRRNGSQPNRETPDQPRDWLSLPTPNSEEAISAYAWVRL